MKTSSWGRLITVSLAICAAVSLSGFKNSANSVRAKWNCLVMQTADDQADITFTAEIPAGWKMYSQKMSGVDGPLPVSIEFDPDPTFQLVGPPTEKGTVVDFFQPELGMEVSCMENTAKYVQHISFTPNKSFAIKCVVNYMLCREGEILTPDDQDFTITITP
jgi:thiol:disulfide interchange protein DsbD